MPPQFATTAVVVMALVCPASASVERTNAGVPAVQVGASRGGFATHLRVEPAGTNTTVSFDVTSTSSSPREVTIPLTLGVAAHVTAMTMRTGERTLTAVQLAPMEAQGEYLNVLHRASDPALLEHVETRDGRDLLNLRVFPVSRSAPVHMELALVVADNDAEWRTIDNMARIVSPDRSLVAIEAPRTVPVIYLCGCAVRPRPDLDKSIIRRYVQRNLPRVKACYDRALVGNKKLAGHVDLHFMIGGDGTLVESSVDGELSTRSPTVRSCIEDELATWTFPSTDESNHTQVNYPLDFVASTN